jgi:hypothetical protein
MCHPPQHPIQRQRAVENSDASSPRSAATEGRWPSSVSAWRREKI